MDDSSLISTAVLTAIWDDQHKDNIELIKPFIINIIYKKFPIGQSIDEEYVITQLREKFCFNKFPHAILKIILKRMKKNRILKLNDKKFIVNADLSKDSKEFENKLISAKADTDKVISAIKKYLEKEDNPKITSEEVEQRFSTFIATYGYNTYGNINYTKTIDRKKEVSNFLIGEFINIEYEKNSYIFQLVLKIIEGYMIANAIYLQINNDNKSSLRKLNCYLDTPFILRVLGYKTEEENQSAKELYDLLLKYDATINCFEHTFQEVIGILNYYKKNINKNKEVTLEYFDQEKYTEGQVEMAISSLADRFKELQIHKVPTPTINMQLKEYNIDVQTLTEKLEHHKEQTGYRYSRQTIDNDVNSVNAINILRKNRKVSKIENCNHIFVTTYNYLKIASREIMTDLSDTDIGLVIDDLDLTTILWLKDFENNADLPKMRLVENALAATNATDEILAKTITFFESIKKDKLINNVENISDCLTKNYLKTSGYIDTIKNDPDSVTMDNFVDFLTKSDRERAKAEEKAKQSQENAKKIKEESQKRENEIKNNFIKEVEEKAERKYNKYLKIFLIIYRIITIAIFLVLLISAFIHELNSFSVVGLIFLAIDVFAIIDTFSPRFKIIEKLVRKLLKNKKRDYIFKETKKIENNFSK